MATAESESLAVATTKLNDDAMYQAFFSAVGSKPNESYEKLLTLLPSAKPDPGGPSNPTKEAGVSALRQLLPPPQDIHPLTKEWLDAAGELDDDVPLEEGDWVDVTEKEELDEEGIPVVSAISRTSSGCILDAPGAVQVDNFTVEEEQEGAPPDTKAAQAAPAAYVPSALSKPAAARGSTAPPRSSLLPASAASAAAGSTQPSAASGAATGPTATSGGTVALQDELRRMSLLQGAEGPQGPGLTRGASGGGQAGSDDEGTLEVLNPGLKDQVAAQQEGGRGVVLAAAPPAAGGGEDELLKIQRAYAGRGAAGAGAGPEAANGAGGASRRSADLPHNSDSGSDSETLDVTTVGHANGVADAGAAAGSKASEEGVLATLPGECLATDSGADAQLMSVDTQDMLDRMGLGDDAPAKGAEEPTSDDEGPADMELDLTGGLSAQAPVTTTANTSAAESDKAQQSTDTHQGSAPAAQAAENGDEAVTFVEVEGFKLDPDFDYDNVKLTPREFPYNTIKPARPAPFSR